MKHGATIGANATIICGITLGEYAFIGAGSVVKADVKPYEIIVGVPGRHVGWMCQCGSKLHFLPETKKTECKSCGTEYSLDNNGCHPI